LQFTPKYRRKVFEDEVVKKDCGEAFAAKAKRLGVGLVACEFGPEHVHLFVSGWKNHGIIKLARHFKGYSSWFVRHQSPDRVRRAGLWGDSFWSDGYFYRTVGSVTKEATKYYIEKTQKKHWAGYTPKQTSPQKTLTQFIN
jgi:putative transposase